MHAARPNATPEDGLHLTLSVALTDEDVAAIAAVKQTSPDDIAEIEDYLTGHLEGAVEEAHQAAAESTRD